MPVLDLVAQAIPIFASKGEAKRMIKGNGLSIKKEKVADDTAIINEAHLIHNKYLFVQRGKNFYLIKTV